MSSFSSFCAALISISSASTTISKAADVIRKGPRYSFSRARFARSGTACVHRTLIRQRLRRAIQFLRSGMTKCLFFSIAAVCSEGLAERRLCRKARPLSPVRALRPASTWRAGCAVLREGDPERATFSFRVRTATSGWAPYTTRRRFVVAVAAEPSRTCGTRTVPSLPCLRVVDCWRVTWEKCRAVFRRSA